MSEQLKDRDFTIVIDRSGSMSTRDQAGGKSRWESAYEGTLGLVEKATQYDPDGIALYTFANKHNRHDNVSSSSRLTQIFQEEEPNGGTNLDGVLEDVFKSYLSRKRANATKTNGELCVVVTDGEPNDQRAVMNQITAFTNKLDRDEEFGLLFVQIGKDQGAYNFLKTLDDGLRQAKFDIVDSITMDEVGDRSLSEVFAGAISD